MVKSGGKEGGRADVLRHATPPSAHACDALLQRNTSNPDPPCIPGIHKKAR